MGLFSRKKKVERRKVPGRPDLTAISEEDLYELAMAHVDQISEEIHEGVPEPIPRFLSFGTMMMNQGLDDIGQTLAQTAARYGFITRQVELERMTATLYGDQATLLYDLYDEAEIPSEEPGYVRTINAAIGGSTLPIDQSFDVDEDLDTVIPGWPAVLREMIGSILVRGISLTTQERGQGASVPEDHTQLQAFCYGYMIHVWYELTPIDWLEGIDFEA